MKGKQEMHRKKTIALILVLVMVFAGALPAMAGRGRNFRPGMISGAAVLENLDDDDNGTVTLDEFLSNRTDRWDTRFDALDQNSDGYISQVEYENVPSPGARGRRGRFEIDQTAFDQCMANQLGEAFKARPTWEDVAAFDSSGDGVLDESEFLTYRETRETERFSEIDGSGDGVLDEAEMEAHISQMQALRESHREAHRTCMMEQQEL